MSSSPVSQLPPLESLPEDWSRLLAIAAHPDDLEYGTSCAVASWTALGKEVAYVMVTRGEAGINAWPPVTRPATPATAGSSQN